MAALLALLAPCSGTYRVPFQKYYYVACFVFSIIFSGLACVVVGSRTACFVFSIIFSGLACVVGGSRTPGCVGIFSFVYVP